ncbi:ribosomal protein S18 acetylase RimI-like enzyme [Paenibacillus sp. LBL]|uniref:GNAT family N-acetyltransferase n=1 Tax=Paenibacillus sp. LBL TaxID=2940563 RepID=UPI0024771D6B|nr:GNAT family N-acetyltransferase [Paenibacillus sp. LBL]MDH6669717.1 ribosomal protein S18 acetylase RimI-like enzyme [Paenibacillus sp. LBL]
MITYKPLSELPIRDASELWNQSFEGYIVNASMPLERFIARIGNDGLSLEESLACYVDGAAAGIVMNSFREFDGVKLARNSGTAIAPDFRGKGLGKSMMEKNSELYEKQGVHRAYLEAISTNTAAIRLYQSVGYVIIDRLLIMSNEQSLEELNVQNAASTYTLVRGQAAEVASAAFYLPGEVWQTDASNIRDGECVFVYKEEKLAGYGLFKRVFDAAGSLTAITLFRCEAAPGHPDAKGVLKRAVLEIMQPGHACKRSAFNIRASHKELVEVLTELGFNAGMEQVLMVREYNVE